jgi:CDP-glucose 4,6-dehydratase
MISRLMQRLDSKFWKDKRVLVTGHTGFKGSWLTLWLNRLGAQVTGISRHPHTDPNLYTAAQIADICDSYICDICDKDGLDRILRSSNPEVIFHLAAQPLVRESYLQPLETFSTNVQGTANLLQGMRECENLRVAVMVTTDKVYRNREWVWPYRECDELGGHDPYSASKAASELVIESFRDSFLALKGVAVVSARAGNVIGGGDWSQDRLLPDAIRAWQAGNELKIRRPESVRPWQHVLEPLYGYLILAQVMWNKSAAAGAFNFGPELEDGGVTVKQVIELARKAYGFGEVQYDQIPAGPHEAGILTLDVSKTRAMLGVGAHLRLEERVIKTINWYRDFYAGHSARELCLKNISQYEAQL